MVWYRYIGTVLYHYDQWRSQEFSMGGVETKRRRPLGSGGKICLQPPKARGCGEKCSRADRVLQFFNKNNAFLQYAYFGQNSYFKAITYQLKAFEKQSKRTK